MGNSLSQWVLIYGNSVMSNKNAKLNNNKKMTTFIFGHCVLLPVSKYKK
jgi:hypothetical protein